MYLSATAIAMPVDREEQMTRAEEGRLKPLLPAGASCSVGRVDGEPASVSISQRAMLYRLRHTC